MFYGAEISYHQNKDSNSSNETSAISMASDNLKTKIKEKISAILYKK